MPGTLNDSKQISHIREIQCVPRTCGSCSNADECLAPEYRDSHMSEQTNCSNWACDSDLGRRYQKLKQVACDMMSMIEASRAVGQPFTQRQCEMFARQLESLGVVLDD